ncbi:hypothetical protein BDD12DRAFT_910628 [Trichophaea hybrida]|nr:hypothetical protein BDD12DRAFT_910628 [Trichophaea hybrida]
MRFAIGTDRQTRDVDIEYSSTESFEELLNIMQVAPDLAASTSISDGSPGDHSPSGSLDALFLSNHASGGLENPSPGKHISCGPETPPTATVQQSSSRRSLLRLAAFQVPTLALKTFFFVVPKNLVQHPQSLLISLATSHRIVRSSSSQARRSRPTTPVCFDPTDKSHITTIRYARKSIVVPTLTALLGACADIMRNNIGKPLELGWCDWLRGRTIEDIRKDNECTRGLWYHAFITEGYVLLYCFRRKERGTRWRNVEDTPEKHRRLVEQMRPENAEDESEERGWSELEEESDDNDEDW